MYDSILYPTDGSDGAKAALENVRETARTYDATVHILYVADTKYAGFGLSADPQETENKGMVGTPDGSDSPMVSTQLDTGEFRTKVQAHGVDLVNVVAERFHDIETVPAVRSGTTHEVILDYVDKHDIDIIIMGTHGKTGLSRYLLGSVTEKIVRISDVPVLTIRKEDLLKRPE